MEEGTISPEQRRKNIKYAGSLLIGYTLVVSGILGPIWVNSHKNKSTPTQPSQPQAPHGLSLQRLVRENGGAMELVGTDKEEFRREDRDGDRIYDLQQICSNGKAFYLSSKALSNPENTIESWYPIQKGLLFTMQEMEKIAGEPAQ